MKVGGNVLRSQTIWNLWSTLCRESNKHCAEIDIFFYEEWEPTFIATHAKKETSTVNEVRV